MKNRELFYPSLYIFIDTNNGSKVMPSFHVIIVATTAGSEEDPPGYERGH